MSHTYLWVNYVCGLMLFVYTNLVISSVHLDHKFFSVPKINDCNIYFPLYLNKDEFLKNKLSKIVTE